MVSCSTPPSLAKKPLLYLFFSSSSWDLKIPPPFFFSQRLASSVFIDIIKKQLGNQILVPAPPPTLHIRFCSPLKATYSCLGCRLYISKYVYKKNHRCELKINFFSSTLKNIIFFVMLSCRYNCTFKKVIMYMLISITVEKLATHLCREYIDVISNLSIRE